MPGTMSEADLVTDLKASMLDSVGVFTTTEDADFKRHLGNAAADLTRYRPYRAKQSITLVADQADYTAPAGLLFVIKVLYGQKEKATRKPWEDNYPRVPTAKKYGDGNNLMLLLEPAPTAAMITDLGSSYEFLASMQHAIGANAVDTTVDPGDRALLLLRAQAEAAKEMAYRNIHKPVQLRDSLGGIPRNGTPAALHDQLMKEFERMAA